MRDYPALEIGVDPLAERDTYEHILAEVDGLSLLGVEELWTSVRLTFSDPADRDRAAERVRQAWPDRSCVSTDVPDEDWAARSQANLNAVSVDVFQIAPPWDVPSDPAQPHVVIQPSMGFGTGHHASTWLCAHLLLSLPELTGRRVVDVGTGSGVLALIAAARGAAHVVAIDPDRDALQSARENLELNDAVGRVELRQASLSEAVDGAPFDVVLANLTGALLAREADALAALVTPGGHLIASGMQTHELNDVETAFEAVGVRLVRAEFEDDWVGALFRMSP